MVRSNTLRSPPRKWGPRLGDVLQLGPWVPASAGTNGECVGRFGKTKPRGRSTIFARRRCRFASVLVEVRGRPGNASLRGGGGMEIFIQQLINGISLGSIYGLIAIGYTMVFGIIGMV